MFIGHFRYIDDVVDSVIIYITSIQMRLKLRILLTLKDLLLTLTSTTEEDKKQNKLYDKRDDFTFPIVNFLVISSNIPASPEYGICISQAIRYPRACAQYSDFQQQLPFLCIVGQLHIYDDCEMRRLPKWKEKRVICLLMSLPDLTVLISAQ